MKKQISLLATVLLLATGATASKGQDKRKVEEAVEALRRAMVAGDSAQLDGLTDNALVYGHSGGKAEDKQAFIHSLTSGASSFVSINLVGQTIALHGKTAVVRHELNAVTNDNGKPGAVRLVVMTVWVKNKSRWALLARQAVKPL